jgi:non-ribosomal peptide synthetase component F
MKELSRREGVTLFMSLLAAFQTLLSYYSKQEHVVVGSNIANRNWPGLEPLIGFFNNQLVFHTDLSGNPTFRQLLARVRETALGAYTHQDLPFDKLVEALNPKRDLDTTPIFQVKIDFNHAAEKGLQMSGLELHPLNVGHTHAHFDLALSLEDTGRGLLVEYRYRTDLFNSASILRIAEQFELLLTTVIAQPDATQEELKTILAAADSAHRETQKSKYRTARSEKLKDMKRKQPYVLSQ